VVTWPGLRSPGATSDTATPYLRSNKFSCVHMSYKIMMRIKYRITSILIEPEYAFNAALEAEYKDMYGIEISPPAEPMLIIFDRPFSLCFA
jgi:hypothetical protein